VFGIAVYDQHADAFEYSILMLQKERGQKPLASSIVDAYMILCKHEKSGRLSPVLNKTFAYWVMGMVIPHRVLPFSLLQEMDTLPSRSHGRHGKAILLAKITLWEKSFPNARPGIPDAPTHAKA